ncbi:hypothetical protein [Paenibacillus lautus]|uniref:Uncharacterized protein n=1 Tax=Paenibacillus lautus TaxID=1401 RepID=A0A385TX61_PAELA|nr:hypothetical protein [Paenibacillus lautus]AYB48061.1 hypothetical protein D5F53_32575 [Paenibacillus lautus]VTR56467.1 Uncharacterised protein [Actinobacillus pleuropneumoniae]
MSTIHFLEKAEAKERLFFRKYGKPGYQVHTVTGRANTIERVTEKYVYIKTSSGNEANRIPRERLRQALAILFHQRVITLKELIRIQKFSSALAALIRIIMIDICKVLRTPAGVRLSLKGLRYIYSGISKGKRDVRIVKQNGGLFVLINYFTVRSDTAATWKDNLRELGFDYKCVMLDPGEKTLHEAKRKGKTVKPLDLDEYAEFVKQHSDIIYQFLTIDKIGDPETTQANTLYLERAVGRKPIPVYHVQNSLAVLQDYIDQGYEVIAIGGSVFVGRKRRAQLFDDIFKRFGDIANFHALGVGSTELLLQYPWFSADASSWLNGRIFGKLLSLHGTVRAPIWMTSEESLAFNVRIFSSLEDRYDDMQISIDLLPPR